MLQDRLIFDYRQGPAAKQFAAHDQDHPMHTQSPSCHAECAQKYPHSAPRLNQRLPLMQQSLVSHVNI